MASRPRLQRQPEVSLELPRDKHPMLRLIWFDRQLRAKKFPTARDYAERFEITPRTA